MAEHVDFCTELREKTRKIHDQSDKLINLKLAIVLTDTRLWGEVLSDFYFVFQTIESCVEGHRDHPAVGPLYHPAILRAKAFEEDLEFYLGKNWAAEVKPSPASTAYCDRILEAVKEDPSLLVAYVHSMYLGLVAGGQTIKRVVKRTLGITGEDGGLAIFEFKDIYKTQLRQHIYNAINGLKLSEEKREAIIREKILCFKMNNAIASNVKPTMRSARRLSLCLLLFLLLLLASLLLLFYLVRMAAY